MVFQIRYVGHVFKCELLWFTLDAAVLWIHHQDGRASVAEDSENLATGAFSPFPGKRRLVLFETGAHHRHNHTVSAVVHPEFVNVP